MTWEWMILPLYIVTVLLSLVFSAHVQSHITSIHAYRWKIIDNISAFNMQDIRSDPYNPSWVSRYLAFDTVSFWTMLRHPFTPLSYWYSQYDFNLPESPITPSADLTDEQEVRLHTIGPV